MNDLGLQIVGAIVFAFFVASVVRKVVKPTPKLAGRVRPYTAAARSAFGRTPDRSILVGHESIGPQNVLQRLTRPLLESLVHALTRVFGAAFNDEALALKLRQSAVMLDVPEQDRVHEYRVRQVGAALGWAICAAALAQIIKGSAGLDVAMFVLGGVIGASRRSTVVGVGFKTVANECGSRSIRSTNFWRSTSRPVALPCWPLSAWCVEAEVP